MPADELPEDVMAFIARRIDSVPHLEALLLLCGDAAVHWSDETLAQRVYVSRERAAVLLADLARLGLLAPVGGAGGGYRYDGSWDTGGLMARVAETYRRHLVPVSRFIHAKSASGAVHEFARAFEFKRRD
ncbi:MAG: hypothetical protein HY943_09145 [Gammaproteobacteria bacterium]|nr:hypothetical protein [Gammaproteobacteria bacterium]